MVPFSGSMSVDFKLGWRNFGFGIWFSLLGRKRTCQGIYPPCARKEPYSPRLVPGLYMDLKIEGNNGPTPASGAAGSSATWF